MKIYDGSMWIEASSASIETLDKYEYTATAGQTVFTGSDDNSNVMSLNVGVEMVFLNGVLLEPTTDYTATSSTVTLTAGASLDDELNVMAFGNFVVADAALKATSITAGSGLTGGGTLASDRTISHADTSSQASVDNSGTTFIQDISLDTFGHITNISSASVTIPEAFVSGMILLWSGSTGTIPSGWALCDGTSGTPNLTDRFVVGAGNSYAVDATGGSNSATPSVTDGIGISSNLGVTDNIGVTSGNLAVGVGNLAVANHTLSTAQIPAHTHASYNYQGDNNGGSRSRATSQYVGQGTHATTSTGSSGSHGHTMSGAPTLSGAPTKSGTASLSGSVAKTGTVSVGSVDTRSLYYALAYIMKT
jgi:hypothetical protein